jgi:hypothetical protein
MKRISIAVLAVVVAAGLLGGCATSGTATGAGPGGPPPQLAYLPSQGALGLRAQEDPAFNMFNPFRIAAFVSYPAMLLGQRLTEIPYALAMQLDPDLFGLYDAEQKYLAERWGVKAGLIRDTFSGPPR